MTQTAAVRIAAARTAHKGGSVVLHGTAVVDRNTAFCLVGPSSSGKSTLAAMLVQRGLSLLSEGMVTVRPDRIHPQVGPGPHEFRLCDDAVELLGAIPTDFPLVSAAIPKRRFPAERVSRAAKRLSAVYVLQDGEHDVVDRVRGAQAAALLLQNLYLEGLLDTQELTEALMRCARIAARLHVRRVVRRKDPASLPSLADRIISDPRPLVPERQ